LKKEVLNFWQQNKTQILDCLNVHDVNTWSSELEHDLKTNGAFRDQPAWQILAWMLQRDIVIWDVFHLNPLQSHYNSELTPLGPCKYNH
jgi:hypothetical protein